MTRQSFGEPKPCLRLAAGLIGLGLLAASQATAQTAPPAQPQRPARAGQAVAPAPAQPAGPVRGEDRILAIVNGDVVSRADVVNRARLFALNAGVNLPPDMLDRISAQLIRLLIDERLRMQEVQRRRIPVSDNDVAEAVNDLESRNNLQAGALRQQLLAAGVQPRVLFDQVRAQIGWARLLRLQLGPDAQPTDATVEEAMRAAKARVGQPEYLLSEVFIPLDDPRNEAETRRFVEEVIGQLRRGVPFPMVATQFSQSQSALQGGDLGWQRREEMDDAVAQIVGQMPPGAISNPIKVPGGFQIITLRQKREAGRDIATLLTVRQATFPFSTPLDPNMPTQQQRDALEKAQRLSGSARTCDSIEQANRANFPQGSDRPSDPGQIRLEMVNPPELRQLLGGLTPLKPSQPVVTPEGVLVLMVCTRETRNLAELTPEQAKQQILRDRLENTSRQLLRDLRRRAQIEMRN